MRRIRIFWVALMASGVLTGTSYALAAVGAGQVQVVEWEVRPGGRTGALCRDGSQSFAIGSGACSWHGGVAAWRFTESRSREARSTFLARHERAFKNAGHAGVVLTAILVLLVIPEPRYRW